jgi:peroxiredoxin
MSPEPIANASASLAEQLRERFEYALASRTPEVNAMMDALVERLRRSDTARDAPRAGDRAPEFALPSARGETVRLGELLARGPVVVAFYRGGWCPYCNLQLRAYERVLGEIHALGASLVAISPQLPDGSLSTVERDELSFPVLSDVGNVVARAYGLVFAVPEDVVRFYAEAKGFDLAAVNGAARAELPVPGCFVIGRDGVVALADVDPDYTRRLEPAAILDALRELR